MTRSNLFIGAALLALTSLIALGCSSGGTKALTAEQAAAVVAAGLLAEEDLPATSWEVTEGEAEGDAEDSGAEGEDGPVPDADSMFGETEACQELEAALAQFGGGDGESGGSEETGSVLAEGERTFDAGGDSLILRSVQAGVTVPADPDEVEAGFELLREVFNAETLRPCFEEAFTEGLGAGEESGVVLSELSVTDAANIIEGGIGIAMDVQALAFIITIDLHLEIHMWPEGPAVGSLMMMEMNSTLLQDNQAAILTAARTRLADAVKANQ